tara:strand:+ start:605 stop:1165 length:561 start_codon:yes stop_codon:yes gene_type:complete
MRIISGFLKGKIINYLRNSDTRPLRDSVRENIFNILKHSKLIKTKIINSNILDLYAGIGSFGIECLSRDAKKVTFIEKEFGAVNLLKDNLTKFSLMNKSSIISDHIENCLNKKLSEKFNIFFLDPPFKDIGYINNLKEIKKNRIFTKDHIVIIHRDRRSKDNFKGIMDIILIKQYGRSKIIFGIFN